MDQTNVIGRPEEALTEFPVRFAGGAPKGGKSGKPKGKGVVCLGESRIVLAYTHKKRDSQIALSIFAALASGVVTMGITRAIQLPLAPQICTFAVLMGGILFLGYRRGAGEHRHPVELDVYPQECSAVCDPKRHAASIMMIDGTWATFAFRKEDRRKILASLEAAFGDRLEMARLSRIDSRERALIVVAIILFLITGYLLHLFNNL